MVGRALIIAALALGLSARQADAHGAVTIPMPREAIDGDTAPWNGKVPWPIPFGASSPRSSVLVLPLPAPCHRVHGARDGSAVLPSLRCTSAVCPSLLLPLPLLLESSSANRVGAGADNPNWCAHPSAEAAGKDPRNLTGSLGQACFWFSNGCGIGSPECDGNSGQLVPCCTHKYIFNGTGAPPPFGQCNERGCIVENPAAKKPNPFDPALRPKGAKGGKPTLCDPKARTVNTAAECGSKEDYWQFSPWRAPGSVPVLDSCGVAGGRLPHQGQGTAGADYVNTSNAKLADRGSSLKAAPSGTTW